MLWLGRGGSRDGRLWLNEGRAALSANVQRRQGGLARTAAVDAAVIQVVCVNYDCRQVRGVGTRRCIRDAYSLSLGVVMCGVGAVGGGRVERCSHTSVRVGVRERRCRWGHGCDMLQGRERSYELGF